MPEVAVGYSPKRRPAPGGPERTDTPPPAPPADEDEDVVAGGAQDAAAAREVTEADMALYREHKLELHEAIRKQGALYFQARSETGFCGLYNQGATCYMNSLLQALFLTAEFRDALNAWRYDAARDGPEADCIPLQLQLLFTRMARGEWPAASTKKLTHAFGWSTAASFEQHDVQELCRVFFSALEACSEQFRPLLGWFTGKFLDSLKCKSCGFARSHEDDYMDVQLTIDGCDSVQAALRRFVTPDLLTGDNRWECGGCGEKVDAEKGLQIAAFPPLLTLHLKRFVFDYNLRKRTKLNHAVGFPELLDLADFLAEPPAEPQEYRLYAILMHSGTAMGGHYRAFVRDARGGAAADRWCEFNDAIVTELTVEDVAAALGQLEHSDSEGEAEEKDEAGEENKEGAPVAAAFDISMEPSPPESLKVRWKRQALDSSTGAYMLLYRKVGFHDAETAAPVPEPEHLAALVDEENARYRLLQRVYEVRRYIVDVRVHLTDDCEQITCLELPEYETLDALWRRVAGPDAAPEQSRLRRYTQMGCMGETYGGRGGETLKALGLAPACELLLETRAADAPAFAEFDPRDMHVNLALWDAEGGAVGRSALVVVPGQRDADLSGLRAAIEAAFGLAAGQFVALLLTGAEGAALTGDGARLLQRDLRISSGQQVVVDAVATAEASTALEAYAEAQNVVRIDFNHPDDVHGADYNHSVTTDRRRSLAELKAAIAAQLGLDAAQLHLCRNHSAPQLKDEAQTLASAGLVNESGIFVGHGAPRGVDEVLVEFVRYDPHAKPAISALCSLPVAAASARARDIKESVAGVMNGEVAGGAYLRLREKKLREVGKILRDDLTLQQNLPRTTADGMQVAVQVLAAPETVAADDFVLGVRLWQVAAKKITPPEEIVVSKLMTWGALRERLHAEFAVLALSPGSGLEDGEAERSSVAKSSSFGPPLNLKGVVKLPWSDAALQDEHLLSQPPVSLRDGSVLVLRAEGEYERVRDEVRARKAAAAALGEPAAGAKKPGRRPLGAAKPRFQPRETAIHIRAPSGGSTPATSAENTPCAEEAEGPPAEAVADPASRKGVAFDV